MSSTRFPGKILAPFNGQPMITRVLGQVSKAVPLDKVVVVTSQNISDDPLTAYLGSMGIPVYRGPLENVFARFQDCLKQFPCDWIARVTADSPLWNPSVYSLMKDTFKDDGAIDVVTNVFPRTFPKGNSLEIVKASVLASVDVTNISQYFKEHVMPLFYSDPDKYKIVNIESNSGDQSKLDYCVDTMDDLRRLENFQEPSEGG